MCLLKFQCVIITSQIHASVNTMPENDNRTLTQVIISEMEFFMGHKSNAVYISVALLPLNFVSSLTGPPMGA